PVCTPNIMCRLIHDSYTSSKKLLVFSCPLEYCTIMLTIQGEGFDAYVEFKSGVKIDIEG
ncbi:MAG: hypothetical protein J6C12_11055, partial [Lachnospiraceae bacterium]|nr:hypothetical protein [Lachnospiraceae bacterium]